MSHEQGDIVLVVYRPAVSGPGRKTKSRPMVVVSADCFHAERPCDLLAALVTSKVDKYQGQTDYALQDWQQAGLHQPSAVRMTIATIEVGEVGGKVGKLSERDWQGVKDALRRAMGL